MKSISAENLSISVKVILPICSTLVVATVWITAQIWSLQSNMGQVWTIHDQRQWVGKMKEQNPTLNVPNPDELFWARRPKSTVRLNGTFAGQP